jgi:hypothetical protein
MKSLGRSTLIVAGLAVLAACGSSDPPAERSTEAERQQALRDSAFGGLVEPMDRAAEVEQLQLDRKRELDAAIEQ